MCHQKIPIWISALVLVASVLCAPRVEGQEGELSNRIIITVSCNEAVVSRLVPPGVALVVPVGAPVEFAAKADVPGASFTWTAKTAQAGDPPRSESWTFPEAAVNSRWFITQFSTAGIYPFTVSANTSQGPAEASVSVMVVEGDAVNGDDTYDPPPDPLPPYGGGGPLPPGFALPKVYAPKLDTPSVAIDGPKVMVVNKDDDSADEYWDIYDRKTPVPEEDDLVRVTVVACGGDVGGRLSVSVVDKNSCLNGILWKDAKKKAKLQPDEYERSLKAGELVALSFFLEGWKACGYRDEVKLRAAIVLNPLLFSTTTTTISTEHGLTVFEVDLDIDSDNQDGFNAEFVATEEEDQIEASPTLKRDLCTGLVGSRSERYGKIVFESGFQDADGDGAPDFADGFGLAKADFPAWTNPDPVAVGADVRFVPVQIVLLRPYDPETTQIEISCATVPASVPRDGEGLAKLVATAPDGTQSPAGYQLKTPGIRLWRCPPADRASGVNVPAGDYVPMGCKIAWNDLSKAPTYYRMATLYLEFVDDRADSTLAGTHRLKVKVEQPDCATTEDEVAFTLAVARLAVDYNRDGKVAFDASDRPNARKPFRFWMNNDHDMLTSMNEDGLTNTWIEADVEDATRDCDDNEITSLRDLEDFTRLHLRVDGIAPLLKTGQLQAIVKWADVAEIPAIKLYRSCAENGSRQYIGNYNTSKLQVNSPCRQSLGTISATETLALPATIWNNEAASKPELYFLFEGAARGRGSLRVMFTAENGMKLIGAGAAARIALLDVKEMYERWTAGEVGEPGIVKGVRCFDPAQAEEGSQAIIDPEPRSEVDDFILFVHGWNMEPFGKRAHAETAFKRLWHHGYKGRFGAFFWPTLCGFERRKHLYHYDLSEYIAWHSSAPLLGLLGTLGQKYPGHLHVLAHSMGNVVAAEALHRAPPKLVKNYVASQAAIAADAFHLSPSVTWNWDRIVRETVNTWLLDNWVVSKLILLAPERRVRTPNLYAYYWPTSSDQEFRRQADPKMGNPYMANFQGAEVCHNFCNPRDSALGFWIFDQAVKLMGIPQFRWHDYRSDAGGFWGFFEKEDFEGQAERGLYTERDTYQIFAFCVQGRSNPLGRQEQMGAPFESEFNVEYMGDKFPGHGAQFLYSASQQIWYWNNLLGACNIPFIRLDDNSN